jgi:hypothetical protein
MLAEVVDAVVGVDTHRDTHEVEIALPPGTPIGTRKFSNDSSGFAELRAWIGDHSPGRWRCSSGGCGRERHGPQSSPGLGGPTTSPPGTVTNWRRRRTVCRSRSRSCWVNAVISPQRSEAKVFSNMDAFQSSGTISTSRLAPRSSGPLSASRGHDPAGPPFLSRRPRRDPLYIHVFSTDDGGVGITPVTEGAPDEQHPPYCHQSSKAQLPRH